MKVKEYYMMKLIDDKKPTGNLYDEIGQSAGNKFKFGDMNILGMFFDKVKSMGISYRSDGCIPHYIEYDNEKICEKEIMKILKKHNIKLTKIEFDVDLSMLQNHIMSIETKTTDEFYVIESVYSMESLMDFSNSDVMWDSAFLYLKKLDVENKTLLITDPYLFFGDKGRHKNYHPKLISFFNELNPKKIISFSCDKKRFVLFKNECGETLDKDIILEHKVDDTYHDRFWLCPETKKGVVIGKSLNDVRSKKAYISELDDIDTKAILEDLKFI